MLIKSYVNNLSCPTLTKMIEIFHWVAIRKHRQTVVVKMWGDERGKFNFIPYWIAVLHIRWKTLIILRRRKYLERVESGGWNVFKEWRARETFKRKCEEKWLFNSVLCLITFSICFDIRSTSLQSVPCIHCGTWKIACDNHETKVSNIYRGMPKVFSQDFSCATFSRRFFSHFPFFFFWKTSLSVKWHFSFHVLWDMPLFEILRWVKDQKKPFWFVFWQMEKATQILRRLMELKRCLKKFERFTLQIFCFGHFKSVLNVKIDFQRQPQTYLNLFRASIKRLWS